MRVATCTPHIHYLRWPALPQRIRAGCDCRYKGCNNGVYLCHSAFVRVATDYTLEFTARTCLCHSAFARVATAQHEVFAELVALCLSAFARVATTARPLSASTHRPLPQRIRAGCDAVSSSWFVSLNRLFASAHSRGLRRVGSASAITGASSLPQRIRAGCDLCAGNCCGYAALCLSAFARVATTNLCA